MICYDLVQLKILAINGPLTCLLGWKPAGSLQIRRISLAKSHDVSENYSLKGSLEGAGSFKCTFSGLSGHQW